MPPDLTMLYPAEHAFSITTGPGNLEHVTRAIYVGVAGDIHVLMVGGQEITFLNLAAGILHPIRVQRVMTTGTTATDIIGLY